MSTRPWMPLYIAEYLADTAHLSATESGGYLHLIMHYWQNRGLPKEDEGRRRIARMTLGEWSKSRKTIAAFFTKKWKHKRVEKELKLANEVSVANSEKARGAANKRWLKHHQDQASATLDQCSEHTSSISGAMLQNALSQKQEREEKKDPSQEVSSISRAHGSPLVRIVGGGGQ